MSDIIIKDINVQNGVLSFRAETASEDQLKITVDGIDYLCKRGPTPDVWNAELPTEALNSGICVVVITLEDGAPLASLPITIGQLPAEDVIGEIARLRAELEMVKTSLRRHLRGD